MEARPQLLVRWPFVAVVVFAVAVGAAGAWFHQTEISTMREREHEKLASTGALNARWIATWRDWLSADARRAGRSPFLAEQVVQLARGAATSERRELLRERLALDQQEGSYAEVLLVGPDDRILLSTADPPGAVSEATKQASSVARVAHTHVLSDVYRDTSGHVFIDAVAPIIAPQGQVVATIVMREDATARLYPALESWPVPSATAETVLVLRDGDHVLFLNRQRHKPGEALSRRIPLTRRDLPAVRAVLGERGVFEGVDYRGHTVLSDLRPVDGAPWYVVTKVDTDEALGSVRYRSKLIITLVALLLMTIGAASGYVFRRRQARTFRSLAESERHKRLAQEHLRTTLYSIGDGVIATDAHGLVQVMNPVAEDLTGWTEAEAKDNALDQVFRILSEDSRATVQSPVAHVLREGNVVGLANHTLLVARDGTEHPIADSGAPVRDEHGAIQGVVLVFRDQTEERAALQALRESEENFKALAENADDGVLIAVGTGAHVYANEAAARITGYTVAELLETQLKDLAYPAELAGLQERLRRRLAGEQVPARHETGIKHRSGHKVDVELSAARTVWCGQPADLVLLRDITERQRDRARILALNAMLATIRSVNQLIVRERDVARLLDEACAKLAHGGTFSRSWILLTDDEDRATRGASAGFAPGHGDIVSLVRGGRPPGCLAALGHPSVLHGEQLQRLCADCPLVEDHSDRSLLVVRLSNNGHGRGVLGVSSSSPVPVTDEVRSLVTELAGDVDFALANIEEEQQRKRAEAALQRTAADYKSLADNVPALIARFDSRLRHIYVNLAAARAGRLTPEQYVGKTICESGIPEPTASVREERIRAVFETGQSLEVEETLPTPQGMRHFQTTLVPERAGDGSVWTVLSLARDITERRQSEELLRARMRLLEFSATHSLPELLQRTVDEAEALSGSLVGFYHCVDADERTVSLEAWSSRTVGEFCRADGKGKHNDLDQSGVWVDCVRERKPVVHNDYAALPHKKGLPEEHAPVLRELVVPILRDGRVVAVLGVGNKPGDYTREDVAVVTYLADVAWEIALRKQAESEREALRANLAQSDRLASMGMLCAGVAHEINNPLSYVLYNLQSLAEEMPNLAALTRRWHAELSARAGADGVAEVLGDDQHIFDPAVFDDALARLREALSGTQRIKGIARSLGTFARVERVEVTPVNFQDCIEHAVTMAFNEVKYRARLVKDFSQVPAVLASGGKLAQVFLNLFINAAHAIDEGHAENNEVRVRTWSEGESVFAEVSDTGKGIAPEHQSRIFEPFFTTKGVGVGSGLGLSICQGIIAEFGGEISFTSEVGKGTTFLIRLPRMPQDRETSHEETKAEAPSQPLVRGRILVVDDEAGVRATIVRMLKDGHEVVAVASAEEARALLDKDRRFDVIFCDLMMPEMSGMDLHAWLAGQDTKLAEQMVFVTGGAFTPGASRYLDAVGNVRVEKPFDTAGFRRMTGELVVAARAKKVA
ncbi:MAG: PAS domain S-box protein [Polyangiaceae bacterium]|nr:PAS domain S-box protein [Polyangiaceae bacterium]